MRNIKNILAGIFALATVALVAGCIKEDYFGTCEQPEAGDITIVASLDKMKLTKATVEDNAIERTITHIDIFVVDSEGNIDWYERNADGNDKTQGQGNGYLKLSQKRTTKVNGNYLFEQGEEYKIYLVANSTQTEATMKSLLKLDALEALVEQTEKVYYTGMEEEAPQTFLMDAVAKLDDSEEIVINPKTTPTEHLELKATFNRAASKVIVNIKQGTEVRFVPEGINSVLPQAEFNNLATKTSVLPSASLLSDAGLANSDVKNADDKFFVWDDDTKTFTVTAYTYSHSWEEGADNESALIVNIPMLWDEDGKDEAGNIEINDQAPESWYKIPLSKNNEFGRNYCYIVNLTINAVGAPNKLDIIEFQDVEFVSLPWQEVEMEIGQNEPKYLVLNTDLVEMYNVNEDYEQLTFTSSSPIVSVILKDCYNHDETNNTFTSNVGMSDKDGVFAYYIDKFNQKIQLGTDPGFDIKVVEHNWTKADILAKELNLWDAKQMDENDNLILDENGKPKSKPANEQYIRAQVWEEHKKALNGNIAIYSPILPVKDNKDLNWTSHFNAVRYLEFEVMNEQGLTATFRVEQTPVTVISNVEGFFSYRDDFHIGDDSYVYHNEADWYSPGTYPNLVENSYGRNNKPISKEPAHLLNISVPMFSFAGFQAFHEDRVEGNGEFIRGAIACGNGSYEFEEVLYGNMPRNYYRTFGEKCNGTFHRSHYYYSDGGDFNASSIWKNNNSNASAYYQAVGPHYDKVVQGETRYYRRHYTGNLFETFQSKYVKQVYRDNDDSRTMPILEEVWYCPTCTGSKSINPSGIYVRVEDCTNPTAHKKSFYNGYYDTGKDKKIVKGMGEIYKIMAGGEGDTWITFTALNPLILLPLTSKNNSSWTINRTQVPGAVLHNHRMYHVRVTSTSQEYIIANPKMMDENGNETDDRDRGFTMEGEVNARVVSPSFMIASQLGETIIPQNEAHYVMPGVMTIYELARNQCREYVETRYEDTDNSGNYTPGDLVYHYNDWRLPTKAEIEYIVKHQDVSRAMDKVLSAEYYFHASTAYGQYNEQTLLSDQIPNFEQATKGWYMRCVRDAYVEPAPVTYTSGIPNGLK